MKNIHKKNIMFVLPGLQAGGAERVLIRFMNALPGDRYDRSIAVVNAHGPLKSLIDQSIPLKNLGCRHVLTAIPSLYKTWKERQPAIVISTITHMNFAVLFVKFFSGKTPVIVREAIVPSYFFKKYKFLSPLIRLAYRLLYRSANLVLAPSQVILDELKEIPGMANMPYRLLYNPVPHKQERMQSLIFGSDSFRLFISVGRLDTQKGLDALVEAMKHFKPPYAWRWKIIGEGPQKESLQKQIDDAGLEANIELQGFQEDTLRSYQEADALLLPSRWEGMPNVALEALSFGTPVIALNTAGGIKEIAERASPDSVRIAKDLQEFIAIMQNTPSKREVQNLLPSAFSEEQVFQEFEDMIRSFCKRER
jgi:glycosyltransferase involved in cell wall biosynthesis